ncbi:MAG: MFS transporter [Rhodanobacteraceae bacterium]|nr:MFS transporter [Rhodanobacteraceae bacterium]
MTNPAQVGHRVSTDANTERVMRLANLSIFTIGLGFAIRAGVAESLQKQVFEVVSPGHSGEMVGHALGMTFIGFALTLLAGSMIVDWIGSRRLLRISALAYLVGSAMALAATWLPPGPSSAPLLTVGFLLTGLGWGVVESATNPMVASLDPNNKVGLLNRLHAWWPAGIVAGGLAGLVIGKSGLPWQLNFVLLMIPPLCMLWSLRNVSIPVTERVAQGVSTSDMFRELYRRPQFLLFFACMWLTASTELAPGQWVDLTLSQVVGMDAILILVYVSLLMFVLRHFAGALARKLSGVGLLWLSSVLALLGLYGLSHANGPASAIACATVWGAGVCFMWPTMLGLVSERFPRGGSLFLGLLGFGGGLAIYFLLPQLGAIFDQARSAALASLATSTLPDAARALHASREAATLSFQAIAWIPAALVPIFGLLWFYDRRQQRGQRYP